MERLTRKHDDGSYAVEMSDCKSETEARTMLMHNFKKCCNKLGELEDLEEEIGLQLEFILTKVIGKNYFYIDDYYVNCETATGLGREYDPYRNEAGEWIIKTDCCGVLKPSDYQKTWWLSEEEAERALEGMKDEI